MSNLRLHFLSVATRKSRLRRWMGFSAPTPSHRRDLDFLWSGRRDSNPRPQPWQGAPALPLLTAETRSDPSTREFVGGEI